MTDDFQTEGSAVQRAYAEIADRMASGELRPGVWLREETLATSMGISRTPVREALRRFNSEGLVRIERHRGAQVVAWSREQIAEIYGLRAVVEGYVAAVAAKNIDADSLAALERNLVAYEASIVEDSATVRQQAAALNNEFHAIVLNATGNSSLISLLTGVLGLPLVRRTFLSYTDRDLVRSIEHHRQIIEALHHRDAESAEMIMTVHIRSAQQAVLATQGENADSGITSVNGGG